MKKAEDDYENGHYFRHTTDDGEIEMMIHPTLFGFRVCAGKVGSQSYSLNWCAGDKQKDVEWLYAVMKNILEGHNSFEGLPLASRVKPYMKDEEFVKKIVGRIKGSLILERIPPVGDFKFDALERILGKRE